MKNFKKVLALLLVLVLALSLTACSKKDSGETNPPATVEDIEAAIDADDNTDDDPVLDLRNPDGNAETPEENGEETLTDESAVEPDAEPAEDEDNTDETGRVTEENAGNSVDAVVCLADDVNIRAEDNTDCQIITVAYNGQIFKLVNDDSDNGWYQIELDGAPAYISSMFAEVQSISAAEYKEDVITSIYGSSDEEDDDDSTDGRVTADKTRSNEDGQTR